MKSSRRSATASPGAGRRCSPTSTNTRCTRCASSTSAVRTSSIRRRRSPSLAGGYGRPVAARPRVAGGAGGLPADRHAARSERAAAAGRLRAGCGRARYYEVWARRRGVMPALAHVARRTGDARLRARAARGALGACARPARRSAPKRRSSVRVKLARAKRPRGWGRERAGFAMRRAGTLSAALRAAARRRRGSCGCRASSCRASASPSTGARSASIAGQLAGNSLVPDTATPIAVRLSAGAHRLAVTRAGFSLAPGNGGAAVLDDAFLTPARTPAGSCERWRPATAARRSARAATVGRARRAIAGRRRAHARAKSH